MLGVIWYLLWQLLGVLYCLRTCASLRVMQRVWLGSVCGSLLSIWLPVPFSFIFGFSAASHGCGAFIGFILFAFLYLSHRKTTAVEATPPEDGKSGDRALLWLLIPFTIICVYILVTHTLRPHAGSLYTGQCTYGDMAMHLGFISSIAAQQTFPPVYSILPGAKLCYPFLCDSVSSSLLLFGTPLRWAYVMPMVFALVQVFCGFYFLCESMCKKRGAAALAFIFFFLNGGFGTLYFLHDGGIETIMTSFYMTPTNLPGNGIRWVNVVADMLIPQRATLFGWAVLFAVLFLLHRGVFRGAANVFLPAGIMGGLLPMIHTHSYFALGLVAFCWLVCSAFNERFSRKWLLSWLAFGLPAVLIALPQLIIWTFSSVGGNEQFLRLNIGWVHAGENYLIFWLKNVGPLFIIAPLSLVFCGRGMRQVCSPALLIFVLCELVAFQPNVYDNNKLLYVSYAFLCCCAADVVLETGARIPSRPVRAVLMSLLLVLCTNAAVLTLAREVVSGSDGYSYRLFSADDVEAAEYIKSNTAPDALFLTASNHNNAVAVLTGRNIVCGSPSYLYYHGLDYSEMLERERLMLTDSDAFERYAADLGVDYVYIGYAERSLDGCREAYFREKYPAVFSSGGVTVYKISAD